MNTKTLPAVKEIYDRWQSEDRQLQSEAEKLQLWMRQVEKHGIPRFGETAFRLGPFRELMTRHFDEEDAMLDELDCLDLPNSSALAAMRRQASRDHTHLVHQLDDFVVRLKQLEPPFSSWQDARTEFDLFFIQVEQHEDQERESLQAIMPSCHS